MAPTRTLLAALLLLGLSLASAARPVYQDGYQDCKCTKPRESPYTIAGISAVPSYKSTRYCFDITAKYVYGTCGTFDLAKVEIDIDARGQYSMREVTFDGQSYPASFSNVRGKAVLSVAASRGVLASYTPMEASGAPVQMCFTLPNSMPLEKFCKGECKVTFYDAARKCCPTSSYKAPTPSPCYPSPVPSPCPSPSPVYVRPSPSPCPSPSPVYVRPSPSPCPSPSPKPSPSPCPSPSPSPKPSPSPCPSPSPSPSPSPVYVRPSPSPCPSPSPSPSPSPVYVRPSPSPCPSPSPVYVKPSPSPCPSPSPKPSPSPCPSPSPSPVSYKPSPCPSPSPKAYKVYTAEEV